MRTRADGLRAASVVLLALFACRSVEPLEDRRIGVIHEVEGEPDVRVPVSARPSEPFEVRVRTVGGTCVRREDTELEVAGDTARVTPYDRYLLPRPGLGCLPSEETISHTVDVSFDEAGEAVVLVRGRVDDESDEIRELEYPVEVTP